MLKLSQHCLDPGSAGGVQQMLIFFLEFTAKCRNVGLRCCWKCRFWQRQLMAKAMGSFVLQGGFWFAFKLTDCSYRFERGSAAWHAIIILFPYRKWLKMPCLCCYLLVAGTNIEAMQLQTVAVALSDLSAGSHETLKMRWERLLAFLWKGHVENVGVWGIFITYLVRWSIQKKVLGNFCRKDRILDFEMHWKAQMWYKCKATNEFLDWDNWVLWHCFPSLIYGVRRARKSNVQCSRVLNSVVFKLDPWSRGCF